MTSDKLGAKEKSFVPFLWPKGRAVLQIERGVFQEEKDPLFSCVQGEGFILTRIRCKMVKNRGLREGR